MDLEKKNQQGESPVWDTIDIFAKKNRIWGLFYTA
jgi:hypothetical protein